MGHVLSKYLKYQYLVLLEQTDEHLDLLLRHAVDDLPVVSDQLNDHLCHVQPDIALKPRP